MFPRHLFKFDVFYLLKLLRITKQAVGQKKKYKNRAKQCTYAEKTAFSLTRELALSSLET